MKINVIEYFKETVINFPDKIAVIDGAKELCFAELDTMSKVLACKIDEKGGFNNRPIAVFLPKSISNIIANLSIIYSGNIYSNLDIKSPEVRVQNILKNLQPSLIISDTANTKKLQNFGWEECEVMNIDTIDFSQVYDEAILFKNLSNLIDTDPLCIINTSGSTGTPKGVVLNHKSFIDFTEWAIEYLNISENEVIGSLSPFYFDIYSFELCILMAKSATIVILPEQLASFPARLIEVLVEKDVNFIFWVPTIMVNISNMDILSKFKLENLRKILFAGEVFPTKHLNYWRRFLPAATFVNLYGPIEITLDCTYYIVKDELSDDEPIPIGFPCRNTDILILTDDNKIAKVDEEGELCVRGTSLAMGYWNDPEKTGKAFVQNPLNNFYPELIYRTGDIVYKNSRQEIIFKGRKDSLIKHLGYRIELGEIEHIVVNQLKLVDNCCVVYHSSKKEITMFYENRNPLEVSEFKRKLVEILPKYMVPAVYIHLSEMPKNPNGKIDRLFLNNEVNRNEN